MKFILVVFCISMMACRQQPRKPVSSAEPIKSEPVAVKTTDCPFLPRVVGPCEWTQQPSEAEWFCVAANGRIIGSVVKSGMKYHTFAEVLVQPGSTYARNDSLGEFVSLEKAYIRVETFIESGRAKGIVKNYSK